MHNRQRAAYLTLGARSRPRGRAGAARPEPGQDAPAPPDGRASLWHDKVLDGIDALPDENAQARRHRDGAARPGLQYETGDAHSGRWRIDGSDPRVRRASRTRSRLPNHWRPRFYTTWLKSRPAPNVRCGTLADIARMGGVGPPTHRSELNVFTTSREAAGSRDRSPQSYFH